METRGNARALQAVFADQTTVRERTRGRLIDRGLDPDRVIDPAGVSGPIDVLAFCNRLRPKGRSFVANDVEHVERPLSCFDGCPQAAIPPQAEPSDSHGFSKPWRR